MSIMKAYRLKLIGCIKWLRIGKDETKKMLITFNVIGLAVRTRRL